MNKPMGKIKRFTVAMGIAAVAGAIAGVLLAPKKGKETRAEVKKKADKLSKAFKETKTQIEARSKKVFKDAGHQSVGIYTRAKGMVLGEVEAIKDRESFKDQIDHRCGDRLFNSKNRFW